MSYDDCPRQQTTFKVYLSLLEAFAPNFAKTFQHPGIRGVKLAGVSDSVLDTFIHWLRQEYEDAPAKKRPQNIDWELMEDTDGYQEHDFLDRCYHSYRTGATNPEILIEVFTSTETYDIPMLRWDAINRLVVCFDMEYNGVYSRFESLKIISADVIRRVYNTTDITSPIRKLLVEMFYLLVIGGEEFKTDLPTQCLLDMVKKLAGRVGNSIVCMPKACEFHNHNTKEEQRRCKRFADTYNI
jgi:hypothetical protein